jgi:hypothetical protein
VDQLVRAAAGAVAVLKRDGLTDAACDAVSERAKRLSYAKSLRTGYHGPWWTSQQMALLGKLPDAGRWHEFMPATYRRTKELRQCFGLQAQ